MAAGEAVKVNAVKILVENIAEMLIRKCAADTMS